MSSESHSRRKKPLIRRIKHRLKPFWRKYWGLLVAIVMGLLVAFYVTPALIRFFTEPD